MLARSDQLTIRAWYGHMPTERLARQIHQSVDAVDAEAERLGLRKVIPAKAKAMQNAEAKAKKLRSQSEIAAAARKAAADRAFQLVDSRMALEAAILSEYPNTSNAELAAKYDMTVSQISRIAGNAGVRKSDNHATMARKESGLGAAVKYNKRIKAMRQALEHLRSGDHMTALNILEEALA